MENEFLHEINVSKLLEETGLTISGLSELIDKEVQTINRWGKDKEHKGNRPIYNAIIKMLRKGATVETLFGVEYAKMHGIENIAPTEFLEGLKGAKDPESALNALVERKIMEMKSKGKI